MSHYTTIKTRLTDTKALLEALAELGFKQIEVHEQAQPLYGYRGDQRSLTAEIIIRRKFVGTASNDIGFKRQAGGIFEAIISDFDHRKYAQHWLDKLAVRHAYHAVKAKLEEQGFTLVNEETSRNGQIHLLLRRAS